MRRNVTLVENGNFISVMRGGQQIGVIWVEQFRPSVSAGVDSYGCYTERKICSGNKLIHTTHQSKEEAVKQVYDNATRQLIPC